MELRHLRYFVAVAEELHFTRAAARLGIGQPPLSQQIQQLEQEIGTALFHRLSRGVELTDAGRVFLHDARAVLAAASRAKADAQRVARGEQGQIRVGFTGSASFNMFVPYSIRLFKERYRGISLSLVENSSPPLNEMLCAGLLDVAFVRPPYNAREELTVDPVLEEEMLLALPNDHRLASAGPLPLRMVAGDTFILYPRASGPGLYDRIISACQRAGFSPRIGQDAAQLASTVNLVAAGLGITVVPASMTHVHPDSVSYHPIADDTVVAPLGLAYRRNERSAAVKNFIQAVRGVVESRPPIPGKFVFVGRQAD
jgi:DNA-binding transcriptional LysR family regulator